MRKLPRKQFPRPHNFHRRSGVLMVLARWAIHGRAMPKAVPWSGEVAMRSGTVDAAALCQKFEELILGRDTLPECRRSGCSRRNTKNPSAGKRQSAVIPSARAISMAGEIAVCSSAPMRPDSPAWGLSPKTAMRGSNTGEILTQGGM